MDNELIYVKAVFLNADLDELLFVEWVQGMVVSGYITEKKAWKHCERCLKAMSGAVQIPGHGLKCLSAVF